MGREAKRVLVDSETWLVERTATLEEVHMDNGGITYNVRVSDTGRKPFLSKWFNDPVPAADFLESLAGIKMKEE